MRCTGAEGRGRRRREREGSAVCKRVSVQCAARSTTPPSSTHVIPRDEEADAVGPAHVHLGGALVLVCDVCDEALRLQGAAVDELVVQRLRAHVLHEGATITREARHRDTHVVVDAEELLLVGRQLRGGPAGRQAGR